MRFRLHPAQAVVVGFAVAIVVGTGLLMLPIAKAGPGGATSSRRCSPRPARSA